MRSSGTQECQRSAVTAASAISVSLRLWSLASFTSRSSARPRTPATRRTARSMACFSAKVLRWPDKVTMPSLTITPTAVALMDGSQASSDVTSLLT